MTKLELKTYINDVDKIYNRLNYEFLTEPLLQSLGLDLSTIRVCFETNDTFALKDETFGYFMPVDNSIHINIEDKFFLSVKNNATEFRSRLLFILFHETFHQSLLHTERCNGRVHTLWNIAADFEIHNMLYMYSEFNKDNKDSWVNQEFALIAKMLQKWNGNFGKNKNNDDELCGCFDMKLVENTAEEIYCMIENSKVVEEQTFNIPMQGNGDSESDDESNGNGDSNGKSNNGKKSKISNFGGNGNGNGDEDNNGTGNGTATVTITTYELPNGAKIRSVSIDAPDNRTADEKRNADEQRQIRKQIMEQNIRKEAEKARQRGSGSASIDILLKKLFKVKIDWAKILKSSIETILAKTDYFTWARPRKSTMCLDLPYLPDQCEDNSGYGKLYVCVDQSGSMSNEEFSKISNIIVDAKEHYKKVVVIQHDDEINNVIEFDEISADVLNKVFTRTSCGGTSHAQVFEYIMKDYLNNKYNDEEKISAVIVCSDCCSDIQSEQKKLSKSIPMIYLCPDTAIEYTKGIEGKIIAIS